MSCIRLAAQAGEFPSATAIVADGVQHSYSDLAAYSAKISGALRAPGNDLDGAHVAYLIPPGFDHVAVLWGIWRAGGVAVPLGLGHPRRELDYVVGDSESSILISDSTMVMQLQPIAQRRRLRIIATDDFRKTGGELPNLPAIEETRRGLILYTSGTTSRPKGVVLSHRNIACQTQSLIQAWEWSRKDYILHVLPLHHIHGIVNVLNCALTTGATCEFLFPFDEDAIWDGISAGKATLLMAVPTIYAKLVAAWETYPLERKRMLSDAASAMRLMVSGSAALPVGLLERWKDITSHVLLERYGMTEIGMALSNPLHGQRRPGCVGTALPTVEVRCCGEDGEVVPDGRVGEIEVRGPTVFSQYWQRPAESETAFRHGWFRTGDTAVMQDGAYRILGRTSIDIIKSGGHKISALEIEETMREHPCIDECAVIGALDSEWGEIVSAAVVLAPNSRLTYPSLKKWATARLASYKIPRRLKIMSELPRNAMGKVQKPVLKRQLSR